MEQKKPKPPLPAEVVKAMFENRLKMQADKDKWLLEQGSPGTKKQPYMKSLFELIGLN